SLLDIALQVTEPESDLRLIKLARGDIGAQLLKRRAGRFQRGVAAFALRERFESRIAQQFINRGQQTKEVGLGSGLHGSTSLRVNAEGCKCGNRLRRSCAVLRCAANVGPLAQDDNSLPAYLRLSNRRSRRPNTTPPATKPAAIWGSKKRTKRAPASVISTSPAGTA